MKISILSDLHLGYAYTDELENDSFDNAEEAIEKSLDSDLIIIAGDVFDTRLPKTQTWATAMHILTKPLLKENTGVKLISSTKELKEITKIRTLRHLPVVALHGNHERRSREESNTVQALENAGILIHLHLGTLIFEKDGFRIAIHGMSNVPERYAYEILQQWNPKPIPGCFNILLLHQSIDPYIFSPIEPPTLSLSNLPRGFDAIINGHLHTHLIDKTDSTPMLIVGSTVITQFNRSEAEIPKGFVKIDTEAKSMEFIPLQTARKFFYEELKVEEGKSFKEQLEKKIIDIVYKNFNKKPVIRLKISGKETDVIDQDLRSVEKKYAEKAVLILTKELESPEMTEKLEFLKNLREQRLSPEEMGLNLLRKNLDELKFANQFDYNQIFGLLSEGEIATTLKILLGEQKTLGNW